MLPTQRLHAIAGKLDGTLGLAVHVPKTGETFGHNEHELFPMASVFKIPLLVELFNQIEQGKLDLATRFELRAEDLSAGSGVLKEFRPGAVVSLWDLAVLMIIVSDNSATDLLYRLIDGRRTITSTMRRLGLERIAVPFDCQALLTASVGLDPSDRSLEQRQRVRDRLAARQFDLASIAFQDTLENNCATPNEMLRLLVQTEARQAISRTASDSIIDILLRQQLNQRIPLLLPRETKVAHKTGSLFDVANDAGIIYLPNGDPIIFCAFTKRVPPAKWRDADLAIAEAALEVYQACVAAPVATLNE
jgi:beta-lactamase class A